MLFEFFNALLSLDVNWFVTLIANNLLWLFLFMALIFFFFEGKRVIAGFIAFCLVVWMWGDFEIISGIALFTGSFLLIYYVTKMIVLMFAEETPALKNKLIWISEIHAIVLIIVYNIFLR